MASLASGCGVYLHDAGLKTSTADAKASFDALAVPVLFAAQRQNLRDSAAREDSAVAGYAVSVRNQAVLSLLRPSSRTVAGPDPSATLPGRVHRDLEHVYRAETPGHPWTPEELQVLQNAEEMFVRNFQGQPQTLSLIQAVVRDFTGARRADDRRSTNCPDVAPAPLDAAGHPVPPPAGASRADLAYHGLRLLCDDWRREREFLKPVGPHDFGIADMMAAADATGEIGIVWREIGRREADRTAAAAQVATIQAEINRALHPNGASGDDGGPASVEDSANAAIARVAGLLRNGPAAARKAGLEELATALEQILAAEMRAAAPASPAASDAAPAADAAPTPATDAPAAARTVQATAVLGMIRAGAHAIDAFRTGPATDRAGALLIGLASIRHDLNMAKAELALEDRERELFRAQLMALLRRGAQLAQAHQILSAHQLAVPAGLGSLQSISDPRQRVAASEALAAYARAWDTGEIPYDVLRFRIVQARRLAALERAELTEQDYRALLKPALDALAAYGEGGITQETIVTVLSRLGIAGSILGQ